MRPAEDIVIVSEQERQAVLDAIEAAMAVRGRQQFLNWLGGPFRSVLPHDSIFWVEVGADDDVRSIDCLHHGHREDDIRSLPGDSGDGFVACLARYFYRNPDFPGTLDAALLGDLLALQGIDGGAAAARLHNAVMHRIDLLSGASWLFVLFNVPQHLAGHCRYLMTLLSTHLKMALSQGLLLDYRIEAPAPIPVGIEITGREQEILRLMAEGYSNQQISRCLDISAITLKGHVRKIYRKLDVQHRAAAVARFQVLDASSSVA